MIDYKRTHSACSNATRNITGTAVTGLATIEVKTDRDYQPRSKTALS